MLGGAANAAGYVENPKLNSPAGAILYPIVR